MTEHLFKLKKDGKTVGYLKLSGKIWWKINRSWIEIDPQKGCSEFFEDDNGWDTAHPFVTKDKHGKDVFEADKVYVFGKAPCKVIWSATHRGWAVQLVENPEGLPMSMSSFYPKDIEIIEDKPND